MKGVLLGIMILSSTLTGLGQSNPYADSVIAVFESLSGGERAKAVAEFTRNTNFHEFDHRPYEKYIQQAYVWEQTNPDTQLLNTIRQGHANFLIANGQNAEAVRQLLKVLHSGEAVSTRDSVSIYSFLENLYTEVGAYPEAWEALRMRAGILSQLPPEHPLSVEFKHEEVQGSALIYYNTGDYRKAASGFEKLIPLTSGEQDFHRLAGAHNNLGLSYIELNQPDSAINHFNRSIEAWISKLENNGSLDTSFISLVKGNIAKAYVQKGMCKEAQPLLLEKVKAGVIEGNLNWQINGLNLLGYTYLCLGKPETALQLLDSAGALLHQYFFISGYRNNTVWRVEVLEAMGHTKDAFDRYKELVHFNDSISAIQDRARSDMMQVIYEVEQKNREIKLQRARVFEAEEDAKRQKERQQFMVIGFILLAVIILILGWVIIQRRKRAHQLADKNQRIEQQNKIIEESLAEKEILIKEIHHRVKNNLQLISGILELQAVKFDDNNVREMLREGQSRVRSMALIHQQLYQRENLGAIDFQDYVVKLANDIVVAFNDEGCKIDIHIKVDHFSFDVNTVVPLGLIINELITNTIKHAFKGRGSGNIHIDIQQDGEEFYKLTIRDDGLGLPPDFDPDKSSSLGLRLVKGLSRQLGGDYRFENCDGSKFIIRFKDNHFS